MKKTSQELIDLCSEICYYAQEHSQDECWGPRTKSNLVHILQTTSFTIACFLAQNTILGEEGVEWEIVIDKLVGPVMNLDDWKKFFTKLVNEFNQVN